MPTSEPDSPSPDPAVATDLQAAILRLSDAKDAARRAQRAYYAANLAVGDVAETSEALGPPGDHETAAEQDRRRTLAAAQETASQRSRDALKELTRAREARREATVAHLILENMNARSAP